VFFAPDMLVFATLGHYLFIMSICKIPTVDDRITHWLQVEPCCWMTYTQHRDTQEVLTTLDKLDIDIDEDRMHNQEEIYRRFGWEDDFHNDSLSRWQKIKPRIWKLFDVDGGKKVIILTLFCPFFRSHTHRPVQRYESFLY
jgi:potassium voltage-gated channel Shaw-related subfamily C protein